MIRRAHDTRAHMHTRTFTIRAEAAEETPILSDAAVTKGKTGWHVYRGAWTRVANERLWSSGNMKLLFRVRDPESTVGPFIFKRSCRYDSARCMLTMQK